jgi:hypothetical protein
MKNPDSEIWYIFLVCPSMYLCLTKVGYISENVEQIEEMASRYGE